MRLNTSTQLHEEKNNRALRRRNAARARKVTGKFRLLDKEKRLHREVKASRLYSR